VDEGTCVGKNLGFIYSFQVPIKSYMYALKKTSIVRSVFFSNIAWKESYEKIFSRPETKSPLEHSPAIE